MPISKFLEEIVDCSRIPNSLPHGFIDIFANLLDGDQNPNMSDVYFPEGEECHNNDKETLEMIMKVDGKCWKTIHPHEMNVFDFTFWASDDTGAHPGNSVSRNPIKEVAEAGEYQLTFPPWHDMDRWYTNMDTKLRFLGRLGDSVPFLDLPEVLKREPRIIGFLSDDYEDSSGTVVCGSPGEVSNKFLEVDVFDQIDRIDVEKPYEFHWEKYFRQRKQTWIEIVLKAPDQLRQRVAW